VVHPHGITPLSLLGDLQTDLERGLQKNFWRSTIAHALPPRTALPQLRLGTWKRPPLVAHAKPTWMLFILLAMAKRVAHGLSDDVWRRCRPESARSATGCSSGTGPNSMPKPRESICRGAACVAASIPTCFPFGPFRCKFAADIARPAVAPPEAAVEARLSLHREASPREFDQEAGGDAKTVTLPRRVTASSSRIQGAGMVDGAGLGRTWGDDPRLQGWPVSLSQYLVYPMFYFHSPPPTTLRPTRRCWAA